MLQAVFLGALTGVFVKGWLGKLLVFPVGVGLFAAFTMWRTYPALPFARVAARFVAAATVCALTSGMAGLVARSVTPAGPQPDWSDSDREEIKQFRESISLAQKAIGISNKQATGSAISPSDLQEMAALTRQAVERARSVSDAVLDKIDSDLRVHYRTEFQRSLELEIANYENLARGVLNAQAQLASQAILDQWGDWYTGKRQALQERIGK